jgi:DNA-binding NarL/FixJ family response regulator
VVADDHPVTRVGTIAILTRDAELTVVGEASTGDEAITLCRELQPELLILDVRLPHVDGLHVAQQVTQEALSPVILLLSAYPDAALVRVGLTVGAAGYALKSAPGTALLNAIHRVMNGERPVLVGVSMPEESEVVTLSAQETVVLSHVADGLTTKEIAQRLNVSTRTIDTYLSRIFQKLGATTRTQAVTIARRMNLLSEA